MKKYIRIFIFSIIINLSACFAISQNTLALSSLNPTADSPIISLNTESDNHYLDIDNYNSENTYKLIITDMNNPTHIITYIPNHSLTYMSEIFEKKYGDFSIIAHITNTDGTIISSSNTVTYSKHLTIEMDYSCPVNIAAKNIVPGVGYSVYRSIGNTTDFVKIGDYVYDTGNQFFDNYNNYTYDLVTRYIFGIVNNEPYSTTEEYYEYVNTYGTDIIYAEEFIVPGVTYYYQIQTYTTDANGTVYYDVPSNIISATASPKNEIEYTCTPKGYIKLDWSEAYNSSSYSSDIKCHIYKAKKGDTCFTKVKTLTNPSSCNWSDKNVVLGTTYYYMIQYEYENSSEYIYATEALCTFPQTIVTHNTTSPKRMNIKWTKVPNAKGYFVYIKKPGNQDFKYYKKFKNKKRAFNLKVKNGKQYGIKIVSYGTVNGTTLLGSETIYEPYGDYYAFENEPYESKCNRIYKKVNESSPWSKIDKQMTTISVKVWDFKSGMSGKKITKTKYLTCHKKLAPTLKKIFKEIYVDKEKAPIYEIGCYARRSGEHGMGMAVDINSNYNAMFDNGKPTAGSYWNPKKYAYSIKRHGDIENAFEKYGFSRGFWGNRKDYMHFSYFGT